MVHTSTRERLLEAASRIILEESLSQLSIDRIAQRAGLSRRTFFLHFTSKDELLAEVITYLRPAYAQRYRQWAEYLDPDLTVEERIYGLFRNLLEAIGKPGWRGCCFLRISAELGDRQGHPVHAAVAGAQHDLERWLVSELSRGDYVAPVLTARQLVVLINGLLVMQLVHRTPCYGAAVLCMLPDLLAAGRFAAAGTAPVISRLAAAE